MAETTFEYSNHNHRPAGRFIRASSRVFSGIGKVQAQIRPYAERWISSNKIALEQSGPLWVVLGDSMSQGIGASAYDKGFVGQLHKLLADNGAQYRIVNLSVSGARVEDVLNRQLPAMEQLGIDPKLVTVLVGSNDMIKKKYRRDLPKRYHKLLESLPVGTIIASPFGNAGLGAQLNKMIVSTAHERRMQVVENQLGTGVSSWRGKLAEDHFHPNDKGYAELAQSFFKTIASGGTKTVS